jgi:hypothetical protein
MGIGEDIISGIIDGIVKLVEAAGKQGKSSILQDVPEDVQDKVSLGLLDKGYRTSQYGPDKLQIHTDKWQST